MQGTLPLLRSVASVVSHSPSRIPHLRFHIAVRQARSRSRSRRPRLDESRSSLQRQRSQSTFAPAGYIDKAAESGGVRYDAPYQERINTNSNEGDLRWDPMVSDGDTAKVPVDANMNMFDILEAGLPDRILSGLMSDSVGTPFIQQAHDHIFNKALLALDPDYFIEPFKDVARHTRGPRSSYALQTKTIDDRLATFAAYLDRVVALRRENGRRLDLQACNHLLRCAGSMGDAQLAKSVLEKIMPDDGIEADLESYNFFCQALVWSHAFSTVENYNLRVIPRHIQIRAALFKPQNLSGHATAKESASAQGIRDQVLNAFKDCMNKGFTTNELLFTNLMIAMGREADLEGVKSILKSVWNIDVDLLGAYDEEELESPTFYETNHPLRPSEKLLYAVAHIFGSNNDIRTAWLLVDVISRNYDLRVTERVWLHLCEWAFVLSLRRSEAGRKQGRDVGRISQQTFTQMLEVMIDEPHNIQPNAVIHYLLSRSWSDRKHLDNTIHHVEKLAEIVDKQHATVKNLERRVIEYADQAVRSGRPNAFAIDDFYQLRRQYTLEFYDFNKSLQLVKIAVHRHLLAGKDWPGSGRLTEWERRRLPHLVDFFANYLPDSVIYQTKTGTVELGTKFKRWASVYKAHKMDLRTLPRIHNAMDIDDQERLNRRMEALPEIIVRAKSYCFNCESIGHTHDRCTNKAFARRAIDYEGEGDKITENPQHKDEDDEDDVGIFVLDPSILKAAVPLAFEPGAEKERSNPTLPFP